MNQVKTALLSCLTIYFLVACQDTDCNFISNENRQQSKLIILSQDEYKSIANDNPSELTSNEIAHLINDFALNKSKSRSASSTNFKVISKYYLSDSPKSKIINRIRKDSIPIIKVSTNTNDIFYLSIDTRCPKIIAYLPNSKDSIFQNAMLVLSESMLYGQILQTEHLRDSLRDSTIQKVRKNLGITERDYDFNNIKEYISIEGQSLSRANVIEYPKGEIKQIYGPFLDTRWDSGAPYSNMMPAVNCSDLWWTEQYPVGVIAVAAAQILAFYEPALSIGNYTMDWSYLKQNPEIVEPNYFEPGDPLDKRNMIASFMKYCSDRCEINYNCTTSSYNMTTVRNFLSGFGINMDNSTGFNINSIKKSIAEVRMVLCHGTSTSGGGHSWILDGYTLVKSGSLYYETDSYLHANMCMGSSGTGYYLINSDNSITFNTGFAEFATNISMYANIRHS
ncbi:C10 family peptidase [Bacteroides acidifaciens]|uniref:C10 family peptidase n=1 Tax=Bacteroides acidifaciens TaxID=85831 RepID=UPI00214A787A|nr:C10 family peptidase [Bacteroides acidifaciens]MCR2007288.1 C10 family peptidase [Bacteroides acidifaciens]